MKYLLAIYKLKKKVQVLIWLRRGSDMAIYVSIPLLFKFTCIIFFRVS